MSSTRLLAIIGIALWLPLDAFAQGAATPADPVTRMIVFPFDTSLPPSFSNVSAKLTYVLVRESENRKMAVSVAKASLADTAAIVGCSLPDRDCEQRILQQLGADEAIHGSAAPAAEPGRVTIELQRLRASSPPVSKSVELVADDADMLSAELGTIIPDFLDTATTAEASGDSGGLAFDRSRVRRSSWIVAGSGAGMSALGVVFWALASKSQHDINRAPTDSAADLERLVELEARGKQRALIGNTLIGIGMLTATLGAILVYQQGSGGPSSSQRGQAVHVMPMAMAGGMGLTVTMGWSL